MTSSTSLLNKLAFKKVRFTLFWQMLLAMSVILCLATGVLWGYLQVNFNSLVQQQTDTFAHTITQQAANSAAEMLMADDHLALSAMLENLVRSSKNIHSIAIMDDQRHVVSQAMGEHTEQMLFSKTYQADILFHKIEAGFIQLKIDNSAIRISLAKTQNTLTFIIIGIGLLAILSSIFIAQKLTLPIKHLQKITQQVAKGDLNPPLPNIKNNEIGDLIKSFKHMLKGLRDKESIEGKFNTFFSKDIAKDILSDLDQIKKPLKSVTGSVLFVDIVGFTQLSESQSPQQIADVLNQYYSLLHQVSKIYWGSVDNYIGDGAMLTFGVHVNDPKHPINAICAAQVFIRLSKALNKNRAKNNLPALQFRLGLHCGDMLAGAIGGPERMQFTISGDTVNSAARLCDIASPDKLIISDSIYLHPSCDSLLVTEASQSVNLKGKSHPINCHALIGLAPQFNRLLMQQEQELKAMQEYA
jgi:adenylate cyclase